MFYVNLKEVSKMRKSRVGAVKNIFLGRQRYGNFKINAYERNGR
jgi:hypothetical protein